jgi:hypothetical protein
MPLDPVNLLARVVAPLATGSSRFDGLTVDAAGAGLSLFPGRLPDPTAERIMDPLSEPVAAPSVEIVPDGPLGGEEIMG